MNNKKITLTIKMYIPYSGHDTTASAISWILYSLAEHPEYQRKCQEEIDRVVSETKSGDLEWYEMRMY
jgi:cytochrome P450